MPSKTTTRKQKRTPHTARRKAREAKIRMTKQEEFCNFLRVTPNITEAANHAGMGRTYVYELAAKDEAFRLAWEEAEAAGVDSLEETAFLVAKGDPKLGLAPCPQMLKFLLQARRPERYRERTEQRISGGGIMIMPALEDAPQ